MSLWSRITNVFRGDRLNRELDEELQSHIEDGHRTRPRPRRSPPRLWLHAAASRTKPRLRLIPWLESLRADAFFGLRQLNKTKTTSAAAILLSL